MSMYGADDIKNGISLRCSSEMICHDMVIKNVFHSLSDVSIHTYIYQYSLSPNMDVPILTRVDLHCTAVR